jgi:hypothetical protein
MKKALSALDDFYFAVVSKHQAEGHRFEIAPRQLYVHANEAVLYPSVKVDNLAVLPEYGVL